MLINNSFINIYSNQTYLGSDHATIMHLDTVLSDLLMDQ